MAARNYMFTKFIQNPSHYLEYQKVWNSKDNHLKYLICQLEACPKSGRLHVQGYAEYDKMMTLKQVKNHLGQDVHLEKRAGSQEQAINYCTKTESRVKDYEPFSIGKKAQQGERTDLKKSAKLIEEGWSVEDIIKQDGNMLRYIKHLKEYKAMIDKPRDRNEEVIVEVIVGEPGTGKTRYVYDKEPDLFVMPETQNSNVWFDGYQGQEAVLFDDFYGGIKYSSILRLLDRYPLKVPVKGGFVQWKPKRIYITSNQHPDKWYKIKDIKALKRRISKISNFEERGNTSPLNIWWVNEHHDTGNNKSQ